MLAQTIVNDLPRNPETDAVALRETPGSKGCGWYGRVFTRRRASGSMSEPQTINRDPPGIADIIARREGDLPQEHVAGGTGVGRSLRENRRGMTQRRQRRSFAVRTRNFSNVHLHRKARGRPQRRGHGQTAEELHRNAARLRTTPTIRPSRMRWKQRTAEQARLRVEMKSAGEAGDYERLADTQCASWRAWCRDGQSTPGERGLRGACAAIGYGSLRQLHRPVNGPRLGCRKSSFCRVAHPRRSEWLRKNDKFFY